MAEGDQEGHATARLPNATPCDPRASGSPKPDPARRMMAEAGLRPGQKILDVGAFLHSRHSQPEELTKFQVVGVHEQPGTAAQVPLRSVDNARSLQFAVEDLDHVELPDATFNAVLAVDCWPSTTLTTAVGRWSRLLDPDGGVAMVTGTDLPVTGSSPPPASEQWAREFSGAGFRVESVRRWALSGDHYATLAHGARQAAAPLRAAIGARAARSYLASVARLDHETRREPACRFAIIARLGNVAWRRGDLSPS